MAAKKIGRRVRPRVGNMETLEGRELFAADLGFASAMTINSSIESTPVIVAELDADHGSQGHVIEGEDGRGCTEHDILWIGKPGAVDNAFAAGESGQSTNWSLTNDNGMLDWPWV